MKTVALILGMSVMALSGCAWPLQQAGVSVEPCEMPVLTNVTFVTTSWAVCATSGRNATLALQANVTVLKENLTAIEGVLSDAWTTMAEIEPGEAPAFWSAYAQRVRDPNGTAMMARAAIEALQQDGGNGTITLNNATISDILDTIDAEMKRPITRAKELSESELEESSRLVMRARAEAFALLGIGAGAGLVVGGVLAVPPMAYVRRRAKYWGAFAKTNDVQRMQRLLAWIGVGTALLGLAATCALVATRWLS